MLLAACAPMAPQGPTVPVSWQPSPNFDERRPNFVILHQTTNDDAERALRTLTDPLKKVSAHYLVGRDGAIAQLVDERARAWHAGESWWGGMSDLNSASIGIELDNNGEEHFASAQIAALLSLLADIKARYRIPDANFLGHGDVAPRRKVDPSRHFPWRHLAENGFGIWCDAPPPAPPGFDASLALQTLGYSPADGDAAARAFRRHWAGDEATAELTDADKAMLYCLVKRKAGG
ncbi:N-acetylmuramoyl-L-alanine amidase [Sulfurisoma sediminicola]|uniref:N-acetylmuramoyl-L-alanine amidase n=2 Tax=Sulfurisoma sediminicola TaxID=1381557 RepID=A0A497XDJ7_9PROT|nr:N-acetylmuramoyl-L-alanine amidase [Sulfurisoma sediminicola]RLJ64625.1 N-acetylmuramoyl-L-alanine amidase [Sulfurisoma sediminicola]